MKIIFLDIDGVINSEKYYRSVDRRRKDWSRFDPFSVLLIEKLIKEFSLKIVISSTWRFGAVNQLQMELKRNKLISYLHKDWSTPVTHPTHRGKEIKLWLDEHPEVTDYIIIDDDDCILEEQKNRFIKTDLYEGMTEEHYFRARETLFAVDVTMK